jgi:hypothetical protein
MDHPLGVAISAYNAGVAALRDAQPRIDEGRRRAMSLLPQSAGIGGWSDVGRDAINLLGNWAVSRAQERAAKRAFKYRTRALTLQQPMGNAVMNLTPGIGGVPSYMLPAAAPAWQDLAAWQQAPVSAGDVFEPTMAAIGGVVPAVTAVGTAIARQVPAIVRAVQRAFPSLAGGAAVALASALASNGFSAGGPYRTESANRAIAYRGDLAACKRLRAAGKAIGYARATGLSRRSVRRGRRC